MIILAIESSCDDTSVALVENGKALSNVISTQLVHSDFGGIVPELASRKHIEIISQVTKKALKTADVKLEEIDAIAVTNSPGLAGSLLVGTNFAKGLSISLGIPVVPINHIEGHIFSGNLEQETLDFPLISLVVSGGHTALFYAESFEEYRMIGSTIDDAAGEAFDKIAKMLGLGYPGGPEIDRLSKSGNKKAYDFPRSMLNKNNFNFSFSGLKTSVRYFLQNNFPNGFESEITSICASVQEAIIEVLAKKTIKAAKQYNCKNVVIGGGVSANSRLRDFITELAVQSKIKIVIPDMSYCIDNAAMIGFIAEKKLTNSDNKFNDLSFTADPRAIRA